MWTHFLVFLESWWNMTLFQVLCGSVFCQKMICHHLKLLCKMKLLCSSHWKNLVHRISAQVLAPLQDKNAMTWGKCIDNVGGPRETALFFALVLFLFSFSVSETSRRQNMQVDYFMREIHASKPAFHCKSCIALKTCPHIETECTLIIRSIITIILIITNKNIPDALFVVFAQPMVLSTNTEGNVSSILTLGCVCHTKVFCWNLSLFITHKNSW